jgi:hypothetical protein
MAKTLNRPFDPSQLQVDRNRSDGSFVANFTSDNREYLPSGFLGRTICLDRLFIATAALISELKLN